MKGVSPVSETCTGMFHISGCTGCDRVFTGPLGCALYCTLNSTIRPLISLQISVCTTTYSGSVSTEGSSLSVVVEEGDEMLRAFTTYSITVVAVSAVWAAVKTVNQ